MTWFVPGRLEVLGKHTDYAGGRSLLAAVDRGITVTAQLGTMSIVARSNATDDPVTLRAGLDPQLPRGHWGHYLQTVIDRLTTNFGPLAPARLSVESTLPLASGLSSSSALIVAVALALADANDLPETAAWQDTIADRRDLAGYLACIENGETFKQLIGQRGVGTFGGSEDHTGMLCCRSGGLTQFSFCPILEERSVPFPEGYVFVIAVSGVAAEKTGAARELYNRAAGATRELVTRWNRVADTPVAALADIVNAESGDVDHGQLARLRELAADEPGLQRRLHQFVAESTRIVPAAGDALAAGDLEAFGVLVDESQRLAEDELGNQIDQTHFLVSCARERGAVAASAFGAGFGGSVWGLLPEPDADAFAAAWLSQYTTAFPEHADAARTFVTRPARPAHRVPEATD
ncbi:MAG: galactokinase family protein [Propioniciclava sp.]